MSDSGSRWLMLFAWLITGYLILEHVGFPVLVALTSQSFELATASHPLWWGFGAWLLWVVAKDRPVKALQMVLLAGILAEVVLRVLFLFTAWPNLLDQVKVLSFLALACLLAVAVLVGLLPGAPAPEVPVSPPTPAPAQPATTWQASEASGGVWRRAGDAATGAGPSSVGEAEPSSAWYPRNPDERI